MKNKTRLLNVCLHFTVLSEDLLATESPANI